MANTGAPTPIYFSGKIKHPNPMPPEESIRTEGGFIHWVMTVWVNEHTPPTEPSALKRFDVRFARGSTRYVYAGDGTRRFVLGGAMAKGANCFFGPLSPAS